LLHGSRVAAPVEGIGRGDGERPSVAGGAFGKLWGSGSGLETGLDLEEDGDLVADHGAAAFERHVDGDAEVLAIDDGGGLEAGDGALAHAGVDAVELELQLDRAGDAAQSEVAVDDVVVTVRADAGGDEGGGGELFGVEEVGRADVGVAVGVLGVDRGDVDL